MAEWRAEDEAPQGAPEDALALGRAFEARTRDDWLALARKALKDADPDTALASRTLDGIDIAPLYTRADLAHLPSAGRPGEAPFVRGFRDRLARPPWDIRALYAENDPAAANRAIHDDLTGGVTAIALRLASPGQFGLPVRHEAIAAALEGVHLDMVALEIEAGDQYIGGAQSLLTLWDERGTAEGLRRGAFNADPLGTLARTGALEDGLFDTIRTLAHFTASNLGRWPNVTILLADGRPYHEAGGAEAEELAATLATAVAYLRALEEEGRPPHKVLPAMAVMLAADADLFLVLAKLRAMRKLIWRLAEAAGARAAPRAMRLAVTTSERMLTRRDIHNNLLRTCLAATAAALGGADAITVLPHTWALGRPAPHARRMARNIGLILQEEAMLGRVCDPLGGSYYVESLSEALARAAWARFQEIERRGGMEEVLRSGWLAERIAETAARRREEIASGARPITGVTRHPNPDEALPAVAPHPAPAPIPERGERVPAIAPRRDAEPFEQDHDAAPCEQDHRDHQVHQEDERRARVPEGNKGGKP